MRRIPDGDAADPLPRGGTWLGVERTWWSILVGQHIADSHWLHPDWLIPFGLAGVAAVAVASSRTRSRIAGSSVRRSARPYSARFAGVHPPGLLTPPRWWLMGLARWATDGRSSPYVYILWLVPLGTSFPYFLLLRDTYQHTNADAGRLTNTRVFFCDPLTRWADLRLRPGHARAPSPVPRPCRITGSMSCIGCLKREDRDEYAREVVEVRGTFANRDGSPTVLDVLTGPREVRASRQPEVDRMGREGSSSGPPGVTRPRGSAEGRVSTDQDKCPKIDIDDL